MFKLENLFNYKEYRTNYEGGYINIYKLGNICVLCYYQNQQTEGHQHKEFPNKLPTEFRPKREAYATFTAIDSRCTVEFALATNGTIIFKRTSGMFAKGSITYITD